MLKTKNIIAVRIIIDKFDSYPYCDGRIRHVYWLTVPVVSTPHINSLKHKKYIVKRYAAYHYTSASRTLQHRELCNPLKGFNL